MSDRIRRVPVKKDGPCRDESLQSRRSCSYDDLLDADCECLLLSSISCSQFVLYVPTVGEPDRIGQPSVVPVATSDDESSPHRRSQSFEYLDIQEAKTDSEFGSKNV